MKRRTSTTEQVQTAYLEALAEWDAIPSQADDDMSHAELKEIIQEDADIRWRYQASMKRLDEIEGIARELISPLLSR